MELKLSKRQIKMLKDYEYLLNSPFADGYTYRAFECKYKTTTEKVSKLYEKYKENIQKKEYQNMKARVKELEEENEKLKDRFIVVNSEHTDYIIEVNKKLSNIRERLKIAEEALKHYANTTMGEEYKKGKFRYLVKRSIDVGTGAGYYLEYDATIAQQALKKMKDINNENKKD